MHPVALVSEATTRWAPLRCIERGIDLGFFHRHSGCGGATSKPSPSRYYSLRIGTSLGRRRNAHEENLRGAICRVIMPRIPAVCFALTARRRQPVWWRDAELSRLASWGKTRRAIIDENDHIPLAGTECRSELQLRFRYDPNSPSYCEGGRLGFPVPDRSGGHPEMS